MSDEQKPDISGASEDTKKSETITIRVKDQVSSSLDYVEDW